MRLEGCIETTFSRQIFAFLKPVGLATAAKTLKGCEKLPRPAAYSTNGLLLKRTAKRLEIL
jgi:hypothetical protein